MSTQQPTPSLESSRDPMAARRGPIQVLRREEISQANERNHSRSRTRTWINWPASETTNLKSVKPQVGGSRRTQTAASDGRPSVLSARAKVTPGREQRQKR